MKKCLAVLLVLTMLCCGNALAFEPLSSKKTTEPQGLMHVDMDPDGSVYPFTGGGDRACTMMIYMSGTNLESDKGSHAATADMKEMVASGCDLDKITVLLLAGGTTEWKNEAIEGNEAAIYEFIGDTFVKRMSLPENTNMGNAETLSAFLKFGYENYPARQYVLNIWDHGGGPLGQVIHDDLNRGDGLFMDELRTALENSPAAEEPLALISFHTCLQGSAEVAKLLAPYADYMLASEEVMSTAFDFNYDFIRDLAKYDSGADIARAIIDATYAQRDSDRYKGTVTMAVIDLAQMKGLSENISAFFTSVNDSLANGDFANISKARDQLYAISKSDETIELVDLRQAVRGLSDLSPEQAKVLLDGIDKAVIYSHNKNTVDDWSSGLSIYFPYKKKGIFTSEKEFYANLDFSEGYAAFISEFQKEMSKPVSSGTILNSVIRPLSQKAQRLTFVMELTDEAAAEILKASLAVLKPYTCSDGSTAFIVTSADPAVIDQNTITGEFINRGLFVVDADSKPVSPIPLNWKRSGDTCQLEVTLTKGNDSTQALLTFQIKPDGSLELLSAYAWDDRVSSYAAGVAVDPEEYEFASVFVPGRLPSDAGIEEWETVENAEVCWPIAECSLKVLDDVMDKDELSVAFLLTDIRQNTYTGTMASVVPDRNTMVWETGDDNYLLIPGGTVTQSDSGLLVTLNVGNPTSEEIYVQISNVIVNGQQTETEVGYIEGNGLNDGIPVGGTGTGMFIIPANALEGVEMVTSISMQMGVFNAATEEQIAVIQGACYLELPLE